MTVKVVIPTVHVNTVDLPQSILERQTLEPVEGTIQALLKEKMPELDTYTLIPYEQSPDQLIGQARGGRFLLIRKTLEPGYWKGRVGQLNAGQISFQTFTRDPNGEQAGAVLQDAIRTVLWDAWRTGWHHPRWGSIARIGWTDAPSRKTDWATSTGPVQYADLPTGVWRFEAQYQFLVRPPRKHP